MFNELLQITGLSSQSFLIVAAAVFAAGLIRGFSGFGLSAILMASVVTIIPPIELIPVCYVLESASTMIMFRGGMKHANMKIVWGLAIGSSIGIPIALFATTNIDISVSKLIALLLILTLTMAQFFRFRPKFLATRKGLYASGFMSGIATGFASVGGLVVALYVLSRDAEPREMRASLVMYLAITMVTFLVYLLLYEMLNAQSLWRGLVFAPIVLIGVFAGTFMFRPSLVHLYKRVCLILLISLCVIGIGRQIY